MSECEKCHGTGKVACSKCGGETKVKCEKCNGKGKFKNCIQCNSTGEEECSKCDGTGKERNRCPVCEFGKVEKTRWINCSECHGTGRRPSRPSESCYECHGRGQVKETYEEICPNCHGEYLRETDKPCTACGGTGKVSCSRCEGTGHAKCQKCGGTGKTQCDECGGEGNLKCPDCEKREREAKERRDRKEREERDRRIVAQEKREAAEKAAKERKDFCVGCGCLLALVAIVGFFIWWWVEGFTMSALSGMWEQTKNAMGGAGGIAKVIGGLVALFLGWKVIAAIKRKSGGSEASTSDKKRWKFVVLGILFGFLGLHLAYAKRWTLFLLLWAGLITGGSFGTSSEAAKSPDAPATQVAQTEQPKSNDNMISNIGFAVWGLLWIGGTLFIKKDGKGNRM